MVNSDGLESCVTAEIRHSPFIPRSPPHITLPAIKAGPAGLAEAGGGLGPGRSAVAR